MFEGLYTALVTPFKDGSLDERALHDLVEWQIESGVNGLVPVGSTGESATLTHAEHGQVIELVVRAARGRVPVVAGTGSNSTAEATSFTEHAKEAGADGALLISPYYNKPSQEGIVAHYAAIADATRFPLIVYNIPGRTGSNILPETLARLALHPHIVGVKEACGDINQIGQVLAACPDDFEVLSGDDGMTLPILALGGKGVISVTSNIAPGKMLALVRACMVGELTKARALHFELLPLFDALFCETNPIPVKAALELMGRIGPEIRPPMTRITDHNRGRVEAALKEQGIL